MYAHWSLPCLCLPPPIEHLLCVCPILSTYWLSIFELLFRANKSHEAPTAWLHLLIPTVCNRINKILVRINLLLSTYWVPIHVPVTMCTYYMLAFIEYQLYSVKLVEPPRHCVYQKCIECHLCDDQLLSNTNIY